MVRRFCVAVSGFKVAGPLAAAVFSEGYETPTLHVLGKNDILVVEERSRVLINVSKTKRVEMHDGGAHPVPLSTFVEVSLFTHGFSRRSFRTVQGELANIPQGIHAQSNRRRA